MLENFINQKYLDNKTIKDLSIKYENGKPFPHIEIENFFKNDLVKDIKSNFPNLEKINSYQRNSKNEKKFGLEDQNHMSEKINNFIMFLNSQLF